jgi:hypothetical protein
VVSHHFPATENSTPMDDEAFRELLTLLETEPIG